MSQTIPVDAVTVSPGRRSLNKAHVEDLAESIREIGLINPITITTDRVLVAGLHRLEAFRSLGREEIPAQEVSLSGLGQELAEIDENLCRNDYTVQERAEHLERRKQIYEALHPETRNPAERGGPGRGHKTNETFSFVLPVGFATDAARKLGMTARSIQTAVRIARDIPKDVRDAIRDTPIADRQCDLIRLARSTPEAQREVVQQLKGGATAPIKDLLPAPPGRKSKSRPRRQCRKPEAPVVPLRAGRPLPGPLPVPPAEADHSLVPADEELVARTIADLPAELLQRVPGLQWQDWKIVEELIKKRLSAVAEAYVVTRRPINTSEEQS